MNISDVRVRQEKLPLKEPYHLSFTTVETFHSSIAVIETDAGNKGAGEATALTGYSSETAEEIHTEMIKTGKALYRLDLERAATVIDTLFENHPFAASAIGTALDFAFDQVLIPEQLSIPMLAPLSPYASPGVVTGRLNIAIENGYKTIKIKVGRDIEQDLKCLGVLFPAAPGMLYRFDANQGYTFDEAVKFVKGLEATDLQHIEALEQPFPPEKWDWMEKLRKLTQIPLMLDESIFDDRDIFRATSVGADLIKLKLCKTKGLRDLIAKANLAHKAGLQVVLGNGVATDMTNLAEAIVFAAHPDIFKGAFEGNGFVKTKSRLLRNSPQVRSGNLVWEKKEALFA